MPSSLLAQWPFILGLLRSSPRSAGKVLDVGPGHGKGSVLLPEFVSTVHSVDAVEACPEYVIQFNLDTKYAKVWTQRFEDMDQWWLNFYDTILMVDVIEHMEKPAALAAIERCRGQLVICTPCFFEEAWREGMPDTEHHVSLWHPSDFVGSAHPVEEVIDRNQGWIFRLGPKG